MQRIDDIALIPHSSHGNAECCGIFEGDTNAATCNECGAPAPVSALSEALTAVQVER